MDNDIWFKTSCCFQQIKLVISAESHSCSFSYSCSHSPCNLASPSQNPFFYPTILYMSHLVTRQTHKTGQNGKKCLWIDFLCFSAVLKSSWSSWKSDEWDDSYCFVLPGLLLHQKATDWKQRTFRKDHSALFAMKLSQTNQIKFIWNYADYWMWLQWFLTKPNEQNFTTSTWCY